MAEGRPVRVGVIGTGSMGGRHARNLAASVAGAQVVAVMDSDRERAERVAEECGHARVHTDPHALITDGAVDAVVVASPDHTHAELTLACIEERKPVLCEKPLATSAALAERVVQVEGRQAGSGQRLVQVGFMREYDPSHRAVFDLIRRGEIGRPLLFRGTHINLAQDRPRTLTDVVVGSAVHDIHTARWLLAEEVREVHARWIPSDPASPDSCRLVVIQMTLANGSLALIEVNAESGYGYEVDVEVTGEQGGCIPPR